MKKYIIGFIMMLFLSMPAYASEGYYFGVGKGVTKLNLDAEQELNQAIDDSGNRLYVEVLDYLGYPVVTNFNLSDSSVRVFVGKDLNKFWDVEVSLERLGSFNVNAYLNVDGSFQYRDLSANGHALVSGRGTLTAETVSLSFVGKLPVTKRLTVYDRLGVSYMMARVSTITNFRHGYNYNYNDDPEYMGSGNYTETKSKRYNLNLFVPYVGLGVKYDLNKEYSVRLEHSRYGNVINDLYVGSTVVELMYRF